MRQITATEKYQAVLEGSMAKREFVRQMRQQYPMYVSQYDGFDSTVKILKNRQMIFEAKKPAFSGVKVYDDRPALSYSLDALDRGIRIELQAMGIDMAEVTVKAEDFKKAESKAKSNLDKDSNHYLNLMAGESNKVNKHDKPKEVKRGALDKDTFNDMKKATLKEEVEEVTYDKDAKLNLLGQVVSALRSKYPEVGARILKDFIKTHGEDLMAGADIEDEFEQYVQHNYDLISSQDEAKGKDHDGDGDIDSDDYLAAKDKAIKKAMGKDVDEDQEGDHNFYDNEEKAEQIMQIAKDAIALMDEQPGTSVKDALEAVIEDMDESYAMKRIQKDRALAHKMGDKHWTDKQKDNIEKAKKETQIKEAIKVIIKKTLTEEVVNEAATSRLSQKLEDFGSYKGAQNVINQLENIITDVESYYGKVREKIQKVYDDMNNIENEEGLNIGVFIGPAIESAFLQDLRPVTKKGFTKDLQLPKAKQLDPEVIAQARAAGEIEEAPEEEKQTVFSPVMESKN